MSERTTDGSDASRLLRRLRDELRLKTHLAGMEARDQWVAAQPQLDALIEAVGCSLRRGAGEARLQLELGAMEARDSWQRIEPRLRRIVDRLREGDGAELRELLRSASETLGRDPRPDAG